MFLVKRRARIRDRPRLATRPGNNLDAADAAFYGGARLVHFKVRADQVRLTVDGPVLDRPTDAAPPAPVETATASPAPSPLDVPAPSPAFALA